MNKAQPLRMWVILIGVLGLELSILWSMHPELLPEKLTPAGARTLGCAFVMAVWWIGSRLPLAIPALLPLALFPILGISNSKAVAAPYADRMVMLLLCGFLLALAVEKWNLHRRIALRVLVTFGSGPNSLAAAVMVITAVLSMWISNTATTLMMLPIVLALVAAARKENDDEESNRRFALLLLLGLAYAASIGGMATPVGTPPNLIFQGQFTETFSTLPEVTFVDWMYLGVPVAAVMLLITWGLLNFVLLRLNKGYRLGDRSQLRNQLVALGGWSRAEVLVAVGFTVTAALWVLRGPLGFPPAIHDSTIAAGMVVVFFLLPSFGDEGESDRLLEWADATRVPWGLLLLFGGGIALSAGFKSSGLTEWLGSELAVLVTMPKMLMVAGICLSVTFLTEVTSNTATTTLLLPILAAVAIGPEGTAMQPQFDPLILMVPATLAASCAFMLPVATAPNAIVVGTGAVRAEDMARTGIALNLIGVIPITLIVIWLL
ncbi:MAG: SLC13 family permease [Myxococcota bacterium]|nr:SLC13 family permease [Myxococcota bacterium]